MCYLRARRRLSGDTDCSNSLKAGAGERTRTADLLITNQLLYQLSYAGLLVKLEASDPSTGREVATART